MMTVLRSAFMTHKRRIVIRNGTVTGFADEVNFEGLTVTGLDKKRVSRVLPTGRFLRICFLVLRAVVSDESKAATWTRLWRCQWNVQIDNNSFGPFKRRSAAILFEKEFIYRQGKLGCPVQFGGSDESVD